MPRILRILFRLISTALAVLLVLGAAAFAAFLFLNSPPRGGPVIPADEERMRFDGAGGLLVEVQEGESGVSVGRRLAGAKVIRSVDFWRFLWRFDSEGFIKAGLYRLEPPATTMALREALVNGEQLQVKVTLAEGTTLKKTARILQEAGVCGEEDFLAAARNPAIREAYRVPGASMEGYLYPDTYFFTLGLSAERVVRAMADTFFARLAEYAPQSAGLSADELNQKVILASIVEREYRLAEEAPIMAGVFYNRLRIGMGLQSCATVEYIITEIQGRPHPKVISTEDTRIKSLYNTYLYRDLPPGPICSPGKTAISAAFAPTESKFFFFRLIDPETGKHHFSSTFNAHKDSDILYTKGP
ncbi:MAG: endolytic transglycosylase MltG [Treponema sp.]|jgi:UPF0755 protein|nr:endolytic transglycosylase MltG [Treponema sp.]